MNHFCHFDGKSYIFLCHFTETYPKIEDACIRLRQALVWWHNLHKKGGVHGETG